MKDISLFFSSCSDDWATPQDFFDSLDREFHFNLDPCASDLNHKCDNYYTIDDDGLTKDWSGFRVFCNPPYGRYVIDQWIKKCYEESLKPNTLVVLLIPARTDKKSFHDFIIGHADIRFVKGRLKFGDQNNFAPFPSLVCIFKGY